MEPPTHTPTCPEQVPEKLLQLMSEGGGGGGQLHSLDLWCQKDREGAPISAHA